MRDKIRAAAKAAYICWACGYSPKDRPLEPAVAGAYFEHPFTFFVRDQWEACVRAMLLNLETRPTEVETSAANRLMTAAQDGKISGDDLQIADALNFILAGENPFDEEGFEPEDIITTGELRSVLDKVEERE